MYDCRNLLSLARRILWLASVREAVGKIPWRLDYMEIKLLVVLKEEEGKKLAYESYKRAEETRRANRSVPFTNALKH